jgi:alcohol dehydrogenase (NADP+)
MRVNAYAAPAAGEPLALTTIERRNVGPNDVLIEIQYVGICHSDIHTVRGHWGPQPFPVVPGHEIVGTVIDVGAQVRKHKVGDRVGVGCMVNSCGECTNCRNGDEQHCLHGMVPTYAGIDRDGTTTQGGYSTHVVVDADYVLSVPEGLDAAVAAPLLCAGITTYAPLRHRGAGPGKEVAVVGLGGLGHMAVKIAHALGAEVTVLSQSLKKQEDGLRLGADHYYATSDPATFAELADRFDLIVNTVSASIALDAYHDLLAVDGTLVNVGAPAEPLSLHIMSLIRGRRAIAGSVIGGITLTQEMTSTSAPSTTSAPTSRSSQPTRPTRHTSVCSPPTCATASSSTPPHSPKNAERLAEPHDGEALARPTSHSGRIHQRRPRRHLIPTYDPSRSPNAERSDARRSPCVWGRSPDADPPPEESSLSERGRGQLARRQGCRDDQRRASSRSSRPSG